MHLKVVTTIETLIDVDDFAETSHAVSITADSGVPEALARAAASGAAKSLLRALDETAEEV
ncbi:hypothetical protein QDW26_gp01 [Microbacterium phage Didgeridoo]|uniref:hypothetical protein n=1 Tax=Microbacterium phage Didgeridoo TaxID=2126928 RepID=UPI000D207738|nr:hypothetical protein QDW26_gp01 [Microbacterium phage Didgeridoo]AVR56669.1 hypothetical protein PBI_DIDGERIDOO_1 [Microbacterium phage Didgeridoo]